MITVNRHLKGERGVEASFGEIVLDRPEKRNALLPEAVEALHRAILDLSADDALGAIAIWGEGKTFCAGFDLTACRDGDAGGVLSSLLTGLSETVAAMRACPKPIVVGVHGGAIAGGCALLAGADDVIAEPSAKFGYPVANLGISPAVSAPSLVAMLGVGSSRSRLLDPGLVDGEEARRIGLVHRLVPIPEDVPPQTQNRAQYYAAKPAHAIRTTKSWVQECSDLDAMHRQGLARSLSLVGSPEQTQRLAAMWARK